MGKPSFIIVGPPKTGTNWLFNNLNRISSVKCNGEIRYFDMQIHRGRQWYESHFPETGVSGECSPSYANLPTERIQKILDDYPKIKVIMILRDPVDRLWSHVKHMYRHRESIFQIFRRQEIPVANIPASTWLTCALSPPCILYAHYNSLIQTWRATVGAKAFKIFFFEDLIRRPTRFMDDACDFLEIPRLPGDQVVLEKQNEGISMSCPPDVWNLLDSLLYDVFYATTQLLGSTIPSRWALQARKALIPNLWKDCRRDYQALYDLALADLRYTSFERYNETAAATLPKMEAFPSYAYPSSAAS